MNSTALDQMRAMQRRCPSDSALARTWHDHVRADAASGAPTTEHGRTLLATARPWPEAGLSIGECACGSSLCFRPAARGLRLATSAG